MLAKNLVKTSSGASDENKIPVLNSFGKINPGFTTSYLFGDGSDGALVVASGTTNLLLDNAYNYSSVSIAVGATLSTAATSGLALAIKCSGSFVHN